MLSAFLVAIFFSNVSPWAAAISVVSGSVSYGLISFYANPFHYIHTMFLTLIGCIAFTLLINMIFFRQRAQFSLESFNRESAD